MKKKPNEQPKEISTPISDKPDHFPIVAIIIVLLFCIAVISYTILITSSYTTDTKIIKVQYASTSTMSVMDMCGHPIPYSTSLVNNQINLSDVYEIDIKTTMFGEEITHFQLLDKEKYIEEC